MVGYRGRLRGNELLRPRLDADSDLEDSGCLVIRQASEERRTFMDRVNSDEVDSEVEMLTSTLAHVRLPGLNCVK